MSSRINIRSPRDPNPKTAALSITLSVAVLISLVLALTLIPILARALYKLVEVGQEIPEQFYSAVAEILAYVYELSGKSRQRPVASGGVR